MKRDKGFTLLEVLAALMISGILFSVAARILVQQWRQAGGLKDRLEINYSMCVAEKAVEDAIRSARSVQWAGNRLEIVPWKGANPGTDAYYLADKDGDGVKDIYCEHSGVPNPLASYLTEFSCMEVKSGFWRISLRADKGGQTAQWENLMRQRVRDDDPLSPDP
ncbi:MAG: type II secretion system GspH family protein [Peptococcaceae bacterium]|jgi:prepilin-type N-terminal cleavage/methylation domain-containing protein|nr:type II secretion system GspH family protein [Peptococcaceae bacterium]